MIGIHRPRRGTCMLARIPGGTREDCSIRLFLATRQAHWVPDLAALPPRQEKSSRNPSCSFYCSVSLAFKCLEGLSLPPARRLSSKRPSACTRLWTRCPGRICNGTEIRSSPRPQVLGSCKGRLKTLVLMRRRSGERCQGFLAVAVCVCTPAPSSLSVVPNTSTKPPALSESKTDETTRPVH